jgi:cell division protease FtsH
MQKPDWLKKPKLPKRPDLPPWLVMVLIFLVVFTISNLINSSTTSYTSQEYEAKGDNIRSFATVMEIIEKKDVVTEIISGNDTWGDPTITIKRKDALPITAGMPPGEWDHIKEIAKAKNIPLDGTYKPPLKVPAENKGSFFSSMLMNFGPTILLIAVFFYFMKKNGPMGAGKAGQPKHRMMAKGTIKERFADFAGNDEAKEDVAEIVDFLHDPKTLLEIGGRVPKGALMVGPPGNGKTLLARCIAGEAEVPFFFVSGSDFVEMFVGVGASRVRALFEDAAKHAPCIVFIDEIDAVGRQRGAGMGGGNDEREQTLNQILVELDGFDQKLGIFVIAATNRPDILDEALKRPGRLTRQINVEAPDLHARKLILEVHARGKKFTKDVSFEHVANSTWGFSGADLEEVLDRAAILMYRRVREAAKKSIKLAYEITPEDLEQALMEGSMKAVLAKSASRRQNPAVKRMLAYHEGGHGLVSEHGYQKWLNSGKEWAHNWGKAVRRLTIVGAANTGGHMQATPDMSTPVETFESLLGDIACALGATISERLFTRTATTGNSADLKSAYGIAKAMVTKFGMSKLGPISVGEDEANPNLGRVMGMGGGAYGLSNRSSEQIDHEIARLLAHGARIAIRALLEREEFLHALVQELMVKETIARAQWTALWEQFGNKQVHQTLVEDKLKEMWPELARLTSNAASGKAILDGEYTVLEK